ncbi:sigma-70 family RNA polymerase sigma factor [Kribbella sp.]|uniref:sigma-70 family RNA polymerase sigma factor n=1 Tax=Kribbella sp. TaxID=1871183 RepID=UPI002D384065|nr:sigma-70 family RNA polymerase sigma factor [Kribbella sp.]HZX01930.1 sigma-70 family RNA polymerase sigma factor [Kribbella sp.]
MDDQQWFADHFAEQRPRLRAIAYRMLGSTTEAEDALQEAWIRSIRSDSTSIDNINAWLTTLVGRVCIDILRARRTHPETAAGTSLPEPLLADGNEHDPEQAALLADSVGLALLVVLDTLDPAERLAFVLHDMFGVPFDELAPILERSPAAARQLASRARRRIRGTPSVPDADLDTQLRVATAFLDAARAGDFEGLLKVLDPEVVFRVDTGSRTWLAPAPLTGAADVAEHAAAHGPRFATLCHPAVVNGAAGVIAKTRGRIVAVVGMTVVRDRITEIDLVLDTGKLARLQ